MPSQNDAIFLKYLLRILRCFGTMQKSQEALTFLKWNFVPILENAKGVESHAKECNQPSILAVQY
jgi:hypothetical protein